MIEMLQDETWTKRWAPRIKNSDKLFTIIFDTLQVMGRVGQVSVLAGLYGKYPEDFKDYLDGSNVGLGYVSLAFGLTIF